MEKEQIIIGIAYVLSRIETALNVQKFEATEKKELAVTAWEKALDKDILNCVENWKKPRDPNETVLPIVGGRSREERDCFFRWVGAETKDDGLTSLIYAVSFVKRKFFELAPDWNHIKEALPFLSELITDLEKGEDWQLQEQITMLKNGALSLRQQALLCLP